MERPHAGAQKKNHAYKLENARRISKKGEYGNSAPACQSQRILAANLMKAYIILVLMLCITLITMACASQPTSNTSTPSVTASALESVAASPADTDAPTASDENVAEASESPSAEAKRVGWCHSANG